MATIPVPRSPITDDNGNVTREWLHFFNKVMASSTDGADASVELAMQPDATSAVAALERRVGELEALLAMTAPPSTVALEARVAALELADALSGSDPFVSRRPELGG